MKLNAPFTIGNIPRILFGEGRIRELPDLVLSFGRRVLLVTGQRSFLASSAWNHLEPLLHLSGIEVFKVHIGAEPSPETIDHLVGKYRDFPVDVVVGIGGGSVMDAAKAIAGLLLCENSVMDFLEGVGPQLPFVAPTVPLIAVPTTAGTGSEATRNAVLTRTGPEGFKKSFRDERLVARWAIIDPDLLEGCPRALIAANGMDALTQLLESFVSSRANPWTDALAVSGIRAVGQGLLAWYDNSEDREARAQMAYGALISGICLAQTGLGSVHGLAQPLGSLFAMPHGLACGVLLLSATQVNLRVLEERDHQDLVLGKYAVAARALLDREDLADLDARRGLECWLDELRYRFKLPGLSTFGVSTSDFPEIVQNARNSSMKTNPVVLTDHEIMEILCQSL